ncbi:MAG: Ig-like domain-containing protein, partial [Propionibacteriaceae bacterium]|nr:Ig-like domain-containing protein [Propionibacteriaceae bacterium]
MSRLEHRSGTATTASAASKWRRALAGIISGALAIGGLSLAPLFSEITVPEAQAAEPVSHQEGTPVWTLSTRLEAVWPQPLDDQSFYHASGSTPGGTVGNVSTVLFQDYGWSEDLSTYKIRPALQFKRIASGGTFTDGVLQTQAMARIGGTSAAPVASTNPAAVRGPAAPLTVYFWNNTGQQSNGEATCPSGHATILRVTSGDKNIYWSCMPISRATGNGGFNPGIDTGHATGGEADQYSGNVYVVGHFNASIDDQSSTSRAASTEAGWVFTVWNPLTGAYALSGSVQPGDWYQGMTTVPKERIKVRANVVGTGNDDPSAPADFALDADGNVYVYSGAEVTASSAANASIVRMEPARNATGDIVDGTAANPWRYYVVTKLKKDPAFPAATWSDAGSVYGNAFLNGQLFLGAYTNVGGTGSYGLPSSASAGPRGTTTIIKIDPLAATMRPVWSVQNDGLTNDTARDNASPQQAAVIRGTLYNDADGDGVISRAEDTLEGQKVAIYDATGKLRAVNETDAKGNYSFIVPWSAGTVYYIRPVQIQIPAADGVTLINAAQTWGAGSVEVGYSSTGTALTNTAAIQCANGNITSELGAACHGAKLPGSSDPALGVVGSTSASSDWLTYAKVTINTSQAVPNADFAFTVRGSYGDAPAGPTTSNVPVHVNQPTASVWLGDNLGSYGGPAADAAAHNGTDDGLYLNSYAGAVPLQGTMLASTKQYQLAATVSGSAADSAKVQAWTTGVGNNTWTTTPKWTPTISGGVATGSFQFQTSGATTGTPTVQLRADVSTATISLPTNSSGQYAAGTAGTPSWTTAGEIEDYTIQVADTVYRPAARTTSGSGTFSVDALSLTADNTAFTIGTAKAAAAGAPKTVTATTPNSSWTVASVAIKDVETGAVKYTPTTSTTGNNTTISWTPTLGDDVVVEVIFSKNPDPAKSTLTLDKESATVGSNITATATIVDADGNPLQNVTVSWAKASADTSISGPTCVTEADGTCFVTITSNVAKTYTDELTAKVNVSGTATQISGSPKTVTFTPGDATAEKSDLAVSPAGPLVVGTGAANTYTATTTARDGNDNLSPNQTIEYTVTKADGSAVDPAKTALSATSCSTSAVVGANYGKCNVTLTSKESGSFLIHATVGGTDVNDSPATVVYTPGSVCIPSATVTCDPDPDKRTEIRVTVDNSPADGESPDIVQARAFDAEGNAIEGAVFTLATTDSTLTVSPLTISTGEDGTVTTDATSQVAGGHQLTGKVNGADLTTQAGSPLTVHFEAGEPDKDQSTLVLSASTATVGAPITATATVKDATGNPLDGRDVTFAITNHGTFGAAADPAVTTATCTTTLPSGACSVTFTDPKVESVEVSAEIMIEGAMTGVSGSPASASFTQGTPKTDCVDPTNPNAEKPNVSATPTTLSVGNDSAVRAYVTDEFCNPVSGVAVDFGVDGSASLADASKQTGSDGVANTTVTDDVAQTVHVTAGFGTHTLPGSPAQVTFEAGDPDPDQSSVALDRASQTVGSSIIATVTVKDAQGNLLDGKDAYVSVTGSATTDGLEGAASTSSCTTDQSGTCTVTIDDKVAEDIWVAATLGSATGPEVSNSPLAATFVPADVDFDKSTFAVDQLDLLVNTNATGTATVVDEFNNAIEGAVVTFGTSLSGNLSASTCTTLDTGKCTVTLTDAVAETVAFSAKIGTDDLNGSPKSVRFKTGGIHVLNSDFTVSPAGPLVADGADFYTGTLTARDADNNLIKDLDLALILFGASSDDVVVSSPVVNHGDGTYTVTYRTTVASPHYTAQVFVDGAQIGGNEPIPFTAGAANAEHSRLAVDPTSLGVGGTSTATVTLRDIHDNLVGGTAADLSVTGAAALANPSCTTNNVFTDTAFGTCSVTLTDNVAETVTVTATLNGDTIPVPTAVTFVVGGVSDKYSDITVAPSQQVVGAAVTVTVKVRDDSNNAINDLTADKFVITTTGDDSQPALAMTGFTPLANGVYTFQTTSKIVGTFTFAAVVDSVPLSERPTAKFTNAGVCVQNCETIDGPNGATRFEMAVNDQLANGTAADKATAYARDTYGNAVPDATVSVVDKTTGVNAGVLSPETATCTTGSDGTCQASWTATSVGTYTGEGTIASLAPGDGSGILNQIRFTNGAANPANSELVVTPTSLPIDTTATATVTVRDNEGILIPGAVVSFSLEDAITGTGQPALNETTCTTGSDGTCFVTLTSSLAGETKVHATLPNGSGVATDLGGNGDQTKGSPVTVTFTPGPVCYSNCHPIDPTHTTRVEVTVNGSEANGSALDVATAYAYDDKGNAVPGVPVATGTTDVALNVLTPTASTGPDGTVALNYSSSVAGDHKATATIDSVVPSGSPLTLTFGSGTADPAHSFLTVSPAGPIKVDETYTITAHANDATNNPVDGAVVAFQIPGELSADQTSCTSVAGVCFITVTTTVAGSYDVGAELSNGALSNSPVTVVFEAGAVCTAADGCVKDPDVDAAHTTRVELTVNGSPADGSTPDVAVVHAFDKHGNAVKDAVVTSTTSDAALAVSTIAPTLAD